MIWNARGKETNNQNNKKERESKQTEHSVSSLWDNFKRSNIHIIGVPEGEETEKEIGTVFEKINFPNLVKEIDIQVQEAQRLSTMMDARSLTPKHTIIKRPKVKDKEILLKAAREK